MILSFFSVTIEKMSRCPWLINQVVIVKTLAIKRLSSTLKTLLQWANDLD